MDKSGVLSYPNLTPAKVFMFKNTSRETELEKRRTGRLISESSEINEIKTCIDTSEIEGILLIANPLLRIFSIYFRK